MIVEHPTQRQVLHATFQERTELAFGEVLVKRYSENGVDYEVESERRFTLDAQDRNLDDQDQWADWYTEEVFNDMWLEGDYDPDPPESWNTPRLYRVLGGDTHLRVNQYELDSLVGRGFVEPDHVAYDWLYRVVEPCTLEDCKRFLHWYADEIPL